MAVTRKALVVGATGAVGEHVVGHLLVSGAFNTVVTVGRRPACVPAQYKAEEFRGELQQVVVNMDHLEAEAAPAFKDVDSVFCCLGTTRKVAGSAEQFLKVDVEYVKATAAAAKVAGAAHFALLTAAGANANVWANNWACFHPLLYAKAKGQAEEAVKAQGFASTAIYRPGLIDRGDKKREIEKVVATVLSSTACDKLAALMVKHAMADERPALVTYEAASIQSGIKNL
ncbi:hypothetical protein V8C86DRAFT_2505908 [Haematococcus lacustris]